LDWRIGRRRRVINSRDQTLRDLHNMEIWMWMWRNRRRQEINCGNMRRWKNRQRQDIDRRNRRRQETNSGIKRRWKNRQRQDIDRRNQRLRVPGRRYRNLEYICQISDLNYPSINNIPEVAKEHFFEEVVFVVEQHKPERGVEEGGGIEEHKCDHDLDLLVEREVQEVYDFDLYLYLYLVLEREVRDVYFEGRQPSVEGDADIDVH
jgi:hypothetical protein